MLATLKLIWRKWKAFAHGLVAAQSWLLMAVAYWTAVMPVAVFFKLFKPDPLDRGLGEPDAGTLAKEHRYTRQDIRRAQRPW